MKYLLLLLILLVAAWWWLGRRSGGAARPDEPPAPRASEDIRRCEQCGVYLPVSEGVVAGKHFYCSQAHRAAAGQ